MYQSYDVTTDPRIVAIRKSDRIYFWSIKKQKICKLERSDPKNSSNQSCEICIPHYQVTKGKHSECTYKYVNFYKNKRHFVSCENKFSRKLIWLKKTDIPDVSELKLEREFGDLSALNDANVWRIEFKSKTIIRPRKNLFQYLKAIGCPCKDHEGKSCDFKILGHHDLVRHLIQLEKSEKRIFVFTGVKAEISRNASISGEFDQLPNKESNSSTHCLADKYENEFSDFSSIQSAEELFDSDSDSTCNDRKSGSSKSKIPTKPLTKTLRRSTGTRKREAPSKLSLDTKFKSSKKAGTKPTYTFIDTSEEEELANRPIRRIQPKVNHTENRDQFEEKPIQTIEYTNFAYQEDSDSDQDLLIEKMLHHVRNNTVYELFPKDHHPEN